jgi:hypothetical protein
MEDKMSEGTADGTADGTAERLRQSIVVLKKLTGDLGIPYESPEIQELKSKLDPYIRTGEPWNGKISFAAFGRTAHVALTRKNNVEITLTKNLRGRCG